MSRSKFWSVSHSAGRIALATASMAAVAVLAACSEGGVASSVAAPSLTPRFYTGPVLANAGTATVCVSSASPIGTYTFSNSGFSTTANPGYPGSTTVETPVDGVSYQIDKTGAAEACTTVLTRTGVPLDAPSDPFSSVTVNNTGTPASVVYSSSDCQIDAGNIATANCQTTSPTVYMNRFHGSKTIFSFAPVASVGCTYTQGWYKNQGNPSVPTTSFFGTAASWQTVLATKPKGNNYYNLADQYIAAKLAIGAGTAPAAVAQAIIDAETFFTGRALGSTDGYATSTLVAIAATLDNFNNGNVAGWPHC